MAVAGAGAATVIRVRCAAVLPQAPLLVPGLVGRGDPAVIRVGRACTDALDTVRALTETQGGGVVLVGGGATTRRHAPQAWGSLAGLGRPIEAPSVHACGPAELPQSLTIGRWLLERAGLPEPTAVQEVAVDATPAVCTDVGAALAQAAGPADALVVMGDGSARRSERGPAFLDPRAEPFDTAVAGALAAGDCQGLLDVDEHLAGDLLVAGRAAWQVLAGAGSSGPAPHAELLLHEAPFGVAYLVAVWRW